MWCNSVEHMGLNKVVGENRRKKIIVAAPSTANDGNKCNDLEKVNISSIDDSAIHSELKNLFSITYDSKMYLSLTFCKRWDRFCRRGKEIFRMIFVEL